MDSRYGRFVDDGRAFRVSNARTPRHWYNYLWNERYVALFSQTGQGEAFWDGGFTGNPPLFPLFEPELPRDIVIVNINPLYREGVPKTPTEIDERINEISFNSSLLRELRAISFVRRLISESRLAEGAMKDVLVHMVADDKTMTGLGAATKVTPTTGTLKRLKAAGQDAADRFLTQHADAIGQRASVDLAALFA